MVVLSTEVLSTVQGGGKDQRLLASHNFALPDQ